MAQLTYRQAVSAALAQEMARDERVVLLGEDVASGGVFKATTGLRERFGQDRVWNTPISEQAMAGAGLGPALGGLRPVAEIMSPTSTRPAGTRLPTRSRRSGT